MRVPDSVRSLARGWKNGSGDGSRLSPLTIGGVTPDRVPISVLRSLANGVRDAREYLATICALKQDGADESILMLSWEMIGSEGYGVIQERNGASGVTRFVVLIPSEHLLSTSPSTLQNPLISGISEVPCDGCGKAIEAGAPYRTDVSPPDQMHIYCFACTRNPRMFPV